MRQIFLIFVLALWVGTTYGQNADGFFDISRQTNKTGMLVLGSWALANIATGAYGWSRYDGSQRYFHQMNLMWNTVNLGIAGIALFHFASTDASMMLPSEMLDSHLRTEKLFLINAGLDVLYMGGGFYMHQLARKGHKRSEMLKGYGNSVMLQGGFLMAFDLAMYFIQRQHRLSHDSSLFALRPVLTPDGIGWVFNF